MRVAVVLAISLAVAGPVAHAACPDLSPAVNYGVASAPANVATGDFNGDGRPDIATANTSTNNVSILLGTGGGAFSAAVHYAASSPRGIAAGDFNRDGRLDLAVTSEAGDNIRILTGNGAGAFSSTATYAAHTDPVFVATADLNRDGHLDLAVANTASNDISILLGSAAGTFGAATNFPAAGASAIAIGDYDRDGDLDLASTTSNNVILILLNNGAGVFGAGASTTVLSVSYSLVTADFNRDGNPDLAVGNTFSDRVSVLFGNGAGAFPSAVFPFTGAGPWSVVAADFTADGNPDIAVANTTAGTVSVLAGNGSGGFAAKVDYAAANTKGIALADFNADGKPDLVSTNGTGSAASVLLSRAACYANCGAFGTLSGFTSISNPYSVATGDFDRNGTTDLAVAHQGSFNVGVSLGAGNGTFGPEVTYSAGNGPEHVVAADFNRDGKLDLATANAISSNVSILIGNGSGAFASPENFTLGCTPRGVTVGDFNRDGAPDLAVTCATELAMVLNTTVALAGTPTFTVSPIASLGISLQGVASGDFNRDGQADLALVDFGDGVDPSSIVIQHGTGTGAFISGGSIGAGSGADAIWARDFNNDGWTDFAVTNAGSSIAVILANGSGGFGSAAPFTVGSGPASIAGGDVNTDGKQDLLIATSFDHSVTVLVGNGAGSFAPSSTSPYFGGSSTRFVVAADFNRDGKDDFATASTDAINIRLNSCPPPDLFISKSHPGNFTQGQTGRYNITVFAAAPNAPEGLISVTDTLPVGLTATAIQGVGWNCTLATLTCTTNTLTGTESILVDVNVSSTAPASVTNTATVSGGADVSPGNNTASDPTTVLALPDLAISKSHTGNFFGGQVGATYSITVANVGRAASSGPVTVTDTLPAGLTATAMAGGGWACTLGTLTCTRSDALAPSGSYPITLTVNVAANAPASVTNVATVSGGGQIFAGNNTASDLTTIAQYPDLTVTKTHAGSFRQGQTGRTYTIVASNGGSTATSGLVTVVDALPAGLTATAMSGSGWTCDVGTLTCSRSDALAPAATYPPITLTATVANNAPTVVTNVATVSGGGEFVTSNNTATDLTNISGSVNCGRFLPAADIASPTNTNMRGIAIGDFNGDGNNDLAATGSVNALFVFPGNGNGTFGAAASYTIGGSLSVPATGDFNGDGKLDIAVASGDNFVAILLGNGNATFAAPVNYAVAGQPYAVAAGDVNGDGKLDLATANPNSASASILLGNGNGTFAAAVSYTTNLSPTVIAIADLNADGKPDLAVATQFQTVSILLGNGDGTFGAKTEVGIHHDPRGIVAADFNNDGKLDLAIAQIFSMDVSILLGNGNGTFAPVVFYDTGDGTYSVAAADLDEDGDIDLAVSRGAGVMILSGAGNGTFAISAVYPAGSGLGAISIAAADLTGDGKRDLATANGPAKTISILLSACPDVTIAKTHSGNFTQGQTGATYSVTVSNTGALATTGTITVTEVPPGSLTVTSLAGDGWTCPAGTLTCSRSDALAAAGSYPPITVTVNVASSAAASVTNAASVSGGGDGNLANNLASDPTTVNASGLIAPTRMTATASSTSQINLSWDSVTGATGYEVQRSDHNAVFAPVVTVPSTVHSDIGLAAGTTYVYRVQAVGGPPSNVDLATTIMFTDDPVVGGVTQIKALHHTELRTAVDAVRAAAGLPGATYTNTISAGAIIRAVDILELRSNLAAARPPIGVPPIAYTDTSLAGIVVKAAHLQEVRSGTK